MISLDQGGQFVDDVSGYALYGNLNAHIEPVTISLEGKHYRDFYPLSAHVDSVTRAFSAQEFEILTYNQVPTVEPNYVEQFGSPNVCITGGRTRADLRLSPDLSVYAWAGYYASYAELQPNKCEVARANRTNTWDLAAGSDMTFENRRSFVKYWIGARTTDREVHAPGEFENYYREGYVRFDANKFLGGGWSVIAQGVHRYRSEPTAAPDPWNEGETYAGVEWAPHWSVTLGHEYMKKRGCLGSDPNDTLCHFINGGLQYRSQGKGGVWGQIFDTVGAFVGQRRGAVRCVAGLCKQVPPFEGAKLEITSRL